MDKIINKMEMKFWAVLGNRHKYATFRDFFYVFKGKTKSFLKKHTLASALKYKKIIMN